MKVTFPHMGTIYIALRGIFNSLGVKTVVPPPCSKKTIALGSRYAPEFACMPLKLNLGNFIEAAEMGADTIIMGGGCGPCRFGYYAHVEYEILRDLGYDYNLIVIEPPEGRVGETLAKIKELAGGKSWVQIWKALSFGYMKAKAVDRLEMLVLKKRPREKVKGTTDYFFRKALEAIDAADTQAKLSRVVDDALAGISSIAEDGRERYIPKVALVGEIYTLLEPFANLDVERRLGLMGVEVERSIYITEWVNNHLLGGILKGMRPRRHSREAACPYLNHFVGGHGQETIGNTVLYAKEGYDGVIQILPFTCMPEIVAESILPRVSTDLDIPSISLIMDEFSGAAGLVTRLEAFVDLLRSRKRIKQRQRQTVQVATAGR